VRSPENSSAFVAVPLALLGLSLGAASTAAQAATCAEEYCYDSVGRLQVALLCGTEYRYTYDAAGNRTSRTVSAGTSPLVCDADSDGLPDTVETDTGNFGSAADTGTDPFLADTDDDGLVDGVETHTASFASASDTGSDPHVADTDGDGVDDGAEVAAGTDPNNPPAAVPGLGPLGLRVLTGLLLLAGGLLAWRARRASGLAATLLLVGPGQALLATPAQAAVCGPGAITLGVGDAKTTQIRAAAADETLGDTSYTLVSNTAPVTVLPASQSTSQLANFQITGTGLGSGAAQIDWSAASGSSGSCTVSIDVVATPPPPTSANNRDAPRWGEVNLFTGERLVDARALLDLGGPLPLGLAVRYASGRVRDGQGASSLGDGWNHSYDFWLFAAGNETRIALSSGRTLRFAESGGSYTLLGPLEIPYQLVADGTDHVLVHPWKQVRFRFNAAGQPVAIFDRNGNTLTLTYDGELLSQASDGLGRTLTFGYDVNHFLAQVSDGTRTVSFSVNAQRQLTQGTDAEGNVTGFAYSNAVADTPSLLTAITYADGSAPYTLGYSATGRVTSRTAAPVVSGGTGGAVSFALAGSAVTVTDEAGEVWSFTFDAEGNLLSEVDPNGDTTTYSYDAQGRPTGLVDAEGRSWSIGYEATAGWVSLVTRPDAATRTLTFATATDGLGVVDVDASGINDYDGSTQTFARDAAGNITSVTDAAGQTWTSSYNARGQLLTATTPTGTTASFAYAADGTLASWTDTAGNVTAVTSDALGRPIQLDHPDITTSQASFDATDAVTGLTDSLGQSIQIARDPLGRSTQVTDRALETWQRTFNAMGLVTSLRDPLLTGPDFSYDARELPSSVADATLQTTTLGHEPAGRVDTVTDPGGGSWSASYNGVGFPVSTSDPLGQTRTFESDVLNRTVGTQSPLGHAWARSLDAMGRTTRLTGPRGRTWTIDRDARGEVQALIAPDGSQVGVTRNASGQITAMTDARGQTWTRSLDAAGRTASTSDPLGNLVTINYDNRNRPSQIDFSGGLDSLNPGYDANGQLIQLGFGDGGPGFPAKVPATLAYTRDANGCLIAGADVTLARDNARRITESNGITLARDAAGRILSVTFGPGQTVHYSYDARGLLASVTDWTNPSPALTITSDETGRRTLLEYANGITTTLSHDADGLLANLVHAGPGASVLASVVLTRGQDGRVTTATRTASALDPAAPLGTVDVAWDAASRPASIGGAAVTHDARLRRTSEGSRSYTWNPDNTLAGYTEGAETVSITSDGFFNPIQIAKDGVVSDLTWIYGTEPPALGRIQTGSTTDTIVSDPQTGLVLYRIHSDFGRLYNHYNENGDTWMITESAGVPVSIYAYTPDRQNRVNHGDPSFDAALPLTVRGAFGWFDVGGFLMGPNGETWEPRTATSLATPVTGYTGQTKFIAEHLGFSAGPDSHWHGGELISPLEFLLADASGSAESSTTPSTFALPSQSRRVVSTPPTTGPAQSPSAHPITPPRIFDPPSLGDVIDKYCGEP